MQTIQDWEDARFAREAQAEIDAVDTVEPERTLQALPAEPTPELVALKGRITAGLGVQLLAEPKKGGRTFITLVLNGDTETIEVPAADALDAFLHPYCYGASLPL